MSPSKKLFSDFDAVSAKQWKQQIQFELKGADYNDTLVWESPEGIKVKPFYHIDETESTIEVATYASQFEIGQPIFVHDVEKSNLRAIDSINRGAESIHFTIENEQFSIDQLMANLPLETTSYFFYLPFLSIDCVQSIHQFSLNHKGNFYLNMDPVGHLAKDGNWFENQSADFEKLEKIAQSTSLPFLSINGSLYQNAGANMVQQLAYTLAHCNEYFNKLKVQSAISIHLAVGSNYFFEIAKLRAMRLLFNTLAKEYGHTIDCNIVATPSKRNKTLYDFNVNMLRTTTECMSAIIGGANVVSNLPYDALYHKDNEFGDRIARNQLLILKNESYFDKVNNPADGTYYIESLTEQLASKALILFKEIESNGGFINLLFNGTIQKKITESAQKEQELFNAGKEVLLGTNKYPNKNDAMKNDLELFPFMKQNPRKTIVVPILEKRLAEKVEQERLDQE